MSVRTLFPNLLHAQNGLRAVRCNALPRLARQAHSSSPVALSLSRARPGQSQSQSQSLFRYGAGLGLGLGFLTYHANRRPVLCEAPVPRPAGATGGQPPESMLNVYQLTFGTVCGICTGVFLKKGLRAIAFLLGGVFVLLQYMSSRSFINVDWKRLASSYDSTFGTKTAEGSIRHPTAGGAYNWFVDFVTANFQQRASFLAGLVLGIRLG